MWEVIGKLLGLPASTLLIVAGLLLLIVAILKKIGSWIDLDRGGRWTAGLLGCGLLVVGYMMNVRMAPFIWKDFEVALESPKNVPSPVVLGDSSDDIQTPMINLPTPTFVSLQDAPTPIAALTPEEAIETYYRVINIAREDESQYRTAWNMLSAKFREREVKEGRSFESHMNFWRDASPVEIQNKTITEEDGRVLAEVQLIHLSYPENDQAHTYQISLIFDEQQGMWLLDDVCENPYTCR
jgi:hypothetical protein